MKSIVLTACILATASIATASADPIEERQALMKSNGRAVGTISKIVKGETAFDAEAVMAALQVLESDAKAMDVERLFPAGTETGGDTEAGPAIWERREDFVAAIEKFRTDTAAAVAANPQDLEALMPQFQAVAANCSSCHQDFRVKR